MFRTPSTIRMPAQRSVADDLHSPEHDRRLLSDEDRDAIGPQIVQLSATEYQIVEPQYVTRAGYYIWVPVSYAVDFVRALRYVEEDDEESEPPPPDSDPAV